jgi:SOS-response transcriptional repressor LexA
MITGPVDGILKVEGDSMLGAGIRPGDAIFYQAINGRRPSPGDTVVAEVEGGAVCKLYQRDDSGEYLVSAPGDTEDRAFFCRVTADVRLLGIVKKHLRDI